MKTEITLSEMQTRLMDMMAELHIFFEQNNIGYFMWAGTMLGAVRHKGFIPWDDDMDIGMMKSEFDKLLYIAQDLPKPYKLRFIGVEGTSEKYPYLYAKIEDTTTVLIEKNIAHLGIISGLYIDLFIFNGIPSGKFISSVHKVKFMYWMNIRKILLMNPEKKRAWIKRLVVDFLQRVFSLKNVIMKAQRISEKYDERSYERVINYSGVYDKMNVELHKSDIIGGKLYQFSRYDFRGVNNPDSVLTEVYGDYMTLPPESERKGSHNYAVIDRSDQEMEQKESLRKDLSNS